VIDHCSIRDPIAVERPPNPNPAIYSLVSLHPLLSEGLCLTWPSNTQSIAVTRHSIVSMSSVLRRAAATSCSLRSMQSTRAIAPLVMQPLVLSRRTYAAHQNEESYDAFNERYGPALLHCIVSWMDSCQLTGSNDIVGTKSSFMGPTTNSKFSVV